MLLRVSIIMHMYSVKEGREMSGGRGGIYIQSSQVCNGQNLVFLLYSSTKIALIILQASLKCNNFKIIIQNKVPHDFKCNNNIRIH